MAEFKLSRLRYKWRNTWATATAYTRDDVIRYSGNTYTCIAGHTASSAFYTDTINWLQITEGSEWTSQWESDTLYNLNDIVGYGGNVYICLTSHTSNSTFASNLNKWQIYVSAVKWRDDWTPDTLYAVNDIVQYNGIVYRCVADHTSSTINNGIEIVTDLLIHNTTVDALLIDGDKDYVKFTIGDFNVSSLYLTKFVSESEFAFFGIQEGDTWTAGSDITLMLAYGEFGTTSVDGNVIGSNILEGQSAILLANTTYTMWVQQTSTNLTEYVFSVDPSNTGTGIIPFDYSDSAGSPTNVVFRSSKFEPYYENLAYLGVFLPGTHYRINDLVKYSGSIWRCITEYTSDDDSTINFIPEFWILEFPGQSFKNDWHEHGVYSIGDIVRHGGYLYIALITNEGEVPTGGTGDWTLVSKNYNLRGTWSETADYKTGDIVNFGSRLYIAENDAQGHDELEIVFIVTIDDAASGEIGYKYKLNGVYRDTPIFEIGNTYIFDQSDRSNVYYPNANGTTLNTHPLHLSADSVNGPLSGGTTYQNQVRYELDGISVLSSDYVTGFATAITRSVIVTPTINTPALYYYCTNHLDMGNSIFINPLTAGINPNTDSNWKVLTESSNWIGGWRVNRLYGVGDEISYGAKNYKCIAAHLSNDTENYPTNGNGYNFWEETLQGDLQNALTMPGDFITFGPLDDLSTLGAKPVHIGYPSQVLTIDSESNQYYKYVSETENFRYVAPDGVDDPQQGTRPEIPWKTIRFATEQAAKLTGFTTIQVNTGIYKEILPIIVPANCAVLGDELRSVTVEAASSLDVTSLDSIYVKLILNRLSDIIPDLIENRLISAGIENNKTQITYLPVSSAQAGLAVQSLIRDITLYIEFYVESGPTDPTITGSNTPTSDEDYHRAIAILQANKEFLAEEAVVFLNSEFSEYTFDVEICKKDVRSYVDAWIYDLIYTGNYKSLLSARYYRNAVLGSSGEDMFYVRDSSGIRHMTLTGLVGNLNPPNIFDLYQIPTGGSYVSLDPGWGPADEAVWITNRSPYIQNCTTLGIGCIGQKIDGAIHNGGNKSIVSNDFTQILSDGIGAWVLNKGRAELVSVFTYYCHVGYLAQEGGTIRGTNGNNSYGKFGALAQGIDPDEVPQNAVVDARGNQATVVSTLAGEFSNEILILEYGNAGQEYTEAAYTVVGAGTGANFVADDFRDRAVFESRITTAGDSTGFGGGGFLLVGNNAQTGDETTITLAASDGNTFATYEGMRIIIVSGPGTGQYGYISAYNNVFKIVSVLKESDGTAGWDHVTAGTPILSLLTTQTTYRIEPRPIFSAPSYSSLTVAIPEANYSAVTFGNTYAYYSSVVGQVGTGTVNVGTRVAATFDITKQGRSYTITLSTAGSGYNIDDEITILGTLLDGVSPSNDVIIKVLSTTTNGLNSINNFEYIGKGSSGRYVAVTSDSASLVWSDNASTWNTVSLANPGNWSSVSAGNNTFVAVRSGSTEAITSINGVSWTSRTLPSSEEWTSVAYGSGTWVVVASDSNAGAYSTNSGVTWTAMTLPIVGDSTISQWQSVTYGLGKFVVISSSNSAVAYSTDGISWIGGELPGEQSGWNVITYGNNRFVAVSETGNEAAISFDGENWISSSLPSQDGSTSMRWTDVNYGQGTFFAVCDTGNALIGDDPTTGPTRFAATSEDGVVWTEKTFDADQSWSSIVFGNPNDVGTWISVGAGALVQKVITGVRATGRVSVSSGRITQVKLWNVGSGYTAPPTLTIVDPNNTSELFVENRIGNGVLSQPSFVNKGSAYKTSSTRVTIVGNGFADIVPVGKFVTLTELDFYPRLGAQILFEDYEQIYTVVNITPQGGLPGNYTATFQISPSIDIQDNYYNGLTATVRERYSQCRLTGHDFLDIGTGNFIETNYPEVDTLNRSPENEVVEVGGGRVFYTSTDQDGNFRTGELFQVEQATGIVTINADYFDLGGLTELALGGVRLGGSGTVIREFSTDATFTENSNNVIPTQRAIRAYLANRLSQGGSELTTGSFVAGVTSVGPAQISTVTDVKIVVPVLVDFSENAAISGMIIAQTMFYSSMA